MGIGKFFKVKSSSSPREKESHASTQQKDIQTPAQNGSIDSSRHGGTYFDASAGSFTAVNHSQILAKHLYKIGVQRRWFPKNITPGSPRDSWSSGGLATPRSSYSRASSDYNNARPIHQRKRSSMSTKSPTTPTMHDDCKDCPATPQSTSSSISTLDSDMPDMSEDSDISISPCSPNLSMSSGSPVLCGSPELGRFSTRQQVASTSDASLVLRIGSSSEIEFYPHIQSTFVYAAKLLNMAVVMKIESHVVKAIIQSINNESCGRPQWDIPVDSGTRIQVLSDMTQIMRARKAQGAAFVVKEKCLLVWADDPEMIVSHAAGLEQRLIDVCLRQIKTKSGLCMS